MKKPMKTDINGHGRSYTIKDGQKRWAKNGNGESRSVLNGNGTVTLTGINQKKYCSVKHSF